MGLLRSSSILAACAVGCLVMNGCSPPAAMVDISSETQVASSDNLDVTVDYLFSEEQFAMSEIEEKVSGGLSR